VTSGIERVLLRAAEVDTDRIRVHSDDGRVTLSGTVRSLAERQEAGFGAWRAKDVTPGHQQHRGAAVLIDGSCGGVHLGKAAPAVIHPAR
jgi:hypothetical protein